MQRNNSSLTQSVDEKLFRLLVANIHDYAIFMIDPHGQIMSWNKGAEKIKGYKESEIIGQNISVFYTPKDLQNNEPQRNLQSALLNGKHEQEGIRIRKDGSCFWANIVFTPLFDEHNQHLGFAKITRDITTRKANDDRLVEQRIELEQQVKANTKKVIESELRFRKLIENSYDGISLFDENMQVFYRSRSSERINGWSNAERADYAVADLVHPNDRKLVEDTYARIFAEPEVPVMLTFRSKHKKGNYIWTECLFSNMLADPNIKAIVCNFRDVSERVEAEIEIKKKTEQIESILERITDGFIALDNDFCYTYANKRIGEILGCSPESLIGKNIWDVYPDVKELQTFKAFNKAATEQQYVCSEDYYAPLNLWHENYIYPSAGGLSVFVRDISERKKAELEILGLNETLEKKVIERTGQLEAANKELESFSYSVSHDLRTPLRAVTGYANMLKEDFGDKFGDEGTRIINTIITNGKMMGQLIDDLLAFSRLGRKQLVLQQVNVNVLVRSCVRELFENLMQETNIVVDDLPPCLGDGTMLKQVWMNLVGNAIKYSSKNMAAKIEIGCYTDKASVTYFIKDNGVGFDMKYADKLFGVFQRLHRNDEFEGTGVGLALAQRIIEKHNGKIWADSSPGAGATFYFSIPNQVLNN